MILEGLIEHQGGIENRIRAKVVAGAEVFVDGELLIRVVK
jgi:ribosome-associated protein YbcJ (S4-like RNA binding protein)